MDPSKNLRRFTTILVVLVLSLTFLNTVFVGDAEAGNVEASSDLLNEEDSDGMPYSEEVSTTKNFTYDDPYSYSSKPEKPDAPDNLHQKDSGFEFIEIGWDGVENAVNYTIYRDGDKIKEGHEDTSFLDEGLEENTEYTYQVSAVNFEGSSDNSNALTASTSEGLSPPTNLEAYSVTSSYVKLRWDAISNTEYNSKIRIYRSSDSESDFNQIDMIEWDRTYYTDSTVSQYVHYEYRITQFNDSLPEDYDESSPSNIVYAFTDPEGPDPMSLESDSEEKGPYRELTYAFYDVEYGGAVKKAMTKNIKIRMEDKDELYELSLRLTFEAPYSDKQETRYIRLIGTDYKNLEMDMNPRPDSFSNPGKYKYWKLKIEVTDEKGAGFLVKEEPELEITSCLNPYDPDTDGDGWNDGESNYYGWLFLSRIKRVKPSDSTTNIFVTADNRRHPGYDDYWEMKSQVKEFGTDENGPLPRLDVRVITDNNKEFKTKIVVQDPNSGQPLTKYLNWDVSVGGSNTEYELDFVYSENYEYELTFLATSGEGFGDPNPFTGQGDVDGDGLTESEEYSLSDNPDPQSVDGRALPTRKDIFVEVDHMDGHEMSYIAKRKVTTRFLNNPTGEEIWLHIDDGLMGGGEEIDDHTEKIATSSDTYTDIDDLKSNYFDNNREDKFHYCIFGHYTYDSDGENRLGVAEFADFIVGDKLIDERDSMLDWLAVFGLAGALAEYITDVMVSDNKAIRQAGVFMHELGHTLDLIHPEPAFKEIQDDIPDIIELPDGYGPLDEHTCMNYWYMLGKVRYTDSEWNDIKLDKEI